MVAALAAGVLGGSLAGCSGDDTTPEPTTPRPDATFSSEFTRTGSGLRWTYRLRANEPAALLAFNGPDADDPDADHPDADPAVWVTPRDDDTVEVAQRLLAPPDGVDVARPMMVHGTVIAPGQEITGTVEVPLPLAVRHPYQGAFDPPLRLPDGAEEVVFCVGVARESEFVPQPTDQPSATPSATPGATAGPTPGPIYAHLSGSLLRQHLFCSAPENPAG